MKTMKALMVHSPHHASVEEVPIPVPGEGEVVVRVKNCGICGTDYHIFEGAFLSPYPIILGHEFSGVISQVGPGVTTFSVGERVTADPTLYCGECEYCLTKRVNHCKRWEALGNTTAGSMAEYVKVPVRNVVHLPDSMSFAQGAFVEPVACVVHGINRLQVQAGDTVLLFGAGAMGLQLVQAIAHSGAADLVVVDVAQDKLEWAMRLGATRGVLSRDAAAELKRDYPDGFDIVVDVTGVPTVIERAFDYMGKAAKYLQFGVAPKDSSIAINPFTVYNNDWTILGSMAVNNTFLPALRWVREGRIKVDELITHRVQLAEVPELLAKPKTADMLKAQVEFEF